MAILKNLLLGSLIFACVDTAFGARLKDIADIEGVRGNQLVGYGLVVGLNGTGDGNKAEFTVKSLSNMLEKMGVRVEPADLKVKNVASVIVTANLPAFVRPGSKIDVTLSSLGDARSLEGGTLVMTPLKGADGNVYAVAQGAITVGGYAIYAEEDQAQKNHPTVGSISQGASVERAIPFDLFQSQKVRVVLRQPDFTTMTRVVREINLFFGESLAKPVDSASVEVPIIGQHLNNPIELVAQLEKIEVKQDTSAKVVVNEKTGTIIMGENVNVSTIALAHGNLRIAIRNDNQVSQPGALAGGTTAIIANNDITVTEDLGNFSVIKGEVTLGELVGALNSLGATPRDLISIFTALKRAGALEAELVVM